MKSTKKKFSDETLSKSLDCGLGNKVLPIMNKMYNNIDIRAVVVKSQDKEWHSAFLKVYFTKESKEDVYSVYKKNQPFRTILKDPGLMLVAECKDIIEIQTVFNEIERGRIILNGISIKLLSEESKNIFSYDLSSNEDVVDLYTTAKQRNGYPQKFICLGTHEIPREIIRRYGVSLTEQSRDIFDFLHPYLDTMSINSSNNNVVIVFPIYCKSIPVSDEEKDKYYNKLRVHNYLLKVSSILLEFRKKGKTEYIDNPKLNDYVYKTQSSDEMINVLLPKPHDQNILDIDTITIQITNEALGPIISDEIALNNLGNVQTIASNSRELSGMVKPYNFQIDSIIMGDVFQNIQNATIISKSNVQNAFNKVKSEHDEETSKALVKVAEFIENSKEPAAGALFNNFTEELNKPQPDKSRLKSFWSGIENALPSITTIAGTVAKIAPLFI